jgi:hypothetical protein
MIHVSDLVQDKNFNSVQDKKFNSVQDNFFYICLFICSKKLVGSMDRVLNLISYIYLFFYVYLFIYSQNHSRSIDREL